MSQQSVGSPTGRKQWPLTGSTTLVHGKQYLGPNAVMYEVEADGFGGWRTINEAPALSKDQTAQVILDERLF